MTYFIFKVIAQTKREKQLWNGLLWDVGWKRYFKHVIYIYIYMSNTTCTSCETNWIEIVWFFFERLSFYIKKKVYKVFILIWLTKNVPENRLTHKIDKTLWTQRKQRMNIRNVFNTLTCAWYNMIKLFNIFRLIKYRITWVFSGQDDARRLRSDGRPDGRTDGRPWRPWGKPNGMFSVLSAIHYKKKKTMCD